MMYLTSISTRLLLHDCTSWNVKFEHGFYNDSIKDISWSDDGKYLLQVNPKGLVEILTLNETEVKSLQHVSLRETCSAAFHRDGHRHVAVGTSNGVVLIWDTKTKSTVKKFPAPHKPIAVNIVSFNATNSVLAATMPNGQTKIYSLTTNNSVMKVTNANLSCVTAMKFHWEIRSLLALATDDGVITLRDIISNQDKGIFKNAHASPVSDICFSKVNRDVLISCGLDQAMHIYDIRVQNQVSTLKPNYPLTSVCLNQEFHVALGTKQGIMPIYDLRNFAAPVAEIKAHTEEIRRVAFQPLRKRNIASESSIKEDIQITVTPKKTRPETMQANVSDYFSNCEPSPKSDTVKSPLPPNEDSFLGLLGLNNSNHRETEKVSEVPKQSDHYLKSDTADLRVNRLPTDYGIAKASTPLSNKNSMSPAAVIWEHSPHTSLNQNGLSFKTISPFVKPQEQFTNEPATNTVSAVKEVVDELKEFINLAVADISDENRNSYLHIMMALTKQKLFLQKELINLNQNVERMEKKQNFLLEENRRLTMEVNYLKANGKYPV